MIKFSRLARKDQATSVIITPEMITALEQVAQELAGDGAVVEAEAA